MWSTNTRIFCIWLIASFLLFTGCQPASSLMTMHPGPTDELTAPFRPDGGFEPVGDIRNEFKNIIWLSIITGSGVGYGCAPEPCQTPAIGERPNWIPQTPRGVLVTQDSIFEWRDEGMSADQIEFATESVKGIRYQFKGRFMISGNFDELSPKEAVLIGRLKKLIYEKVRSEQDISFTWFSWDKVDQETFRRRRPNE